MATTPWRALGKCRFLMDSCTFNMDTFTFVTAAKTTKKKRKMKSLPAIIKPVPVSPILKDFIGGLPEISRPEAVKKLWEYVKLNNLQNPSNKKEIFCDETLKKLFSGKDKVGFNEVCGLLYKHFVKTG